MSPRDEQIEAIRLRTAYAISSHVIPVRISGAKAFDIVDRLTPGELFVRDGQARPGLLLRPDGSVLADLTICRDGKRFLLLAEGPSPELLAEHLQEHVDAAHRGDVEVLASSHAVISVTGPWAWELLSTVIDPDLSGLPYLGFLHHGDAMCLRAGKTGEYGYDLLVPQAELAAWERQLVQAGAGFDLQRVELEAFDQCALENGFFNARREGRERLTPLELQLQWRVSFAKHAIGVAAVARHRPDARSRTVWVLGASRLEPGDRVHLGDRSLGALLHAGFSSTRGEWVGIALVEARFAHPGVRAYEAATASGPVALTTVSPPVVHNRSLAVDPRRHRYGTAAGEVFPPLVLCP